MGFCFVIWLGVAKGTGSLRSPEAFCYWWSELTVSLYSLDSLLGHQGVYHSFNIDSLNIANVVLIGVTPSTLLGVILFFDAALLALGNILFLSGLPLLIGPTKTFYFFSRKQKLRGTVCFFGGVALVFARYPLIGVLIEAIGFMGLFGDFFPVILNFLRQLPFVGTFLSLPYIRGVVDRLAGVRQSAV